MTGQQVDWRTITAKLDRIHTGLETLASMGEVTSSWWEDRVVEALAVERILIVVVDLAVDINNHVAAVELGRVADTYRDTFALAAKTGLIDAALAQALAPSASTRNVLVHQYLDVDHERVALAARLAVDMYGNYVRQAARWVRNRSAAPAD